MPEASAIPQSVILQKQLTSDHIDTWLMEDFLHLRWWALIILYIICFIAWWKLLDKGRLKEMILFTVLAYIIVLGINEYGQELILWDYPMDIIPVFPPLSSVNLLLLPPLYSLVYQRFFPLKQFFWAVLIATAAFCFVIEPLLSWGGYFQLLNWKNWLSIPVFAAMALFVRLLTVKAYKITAESRAASG